MAAKKKKDNKSLPKEMVRQLVTLSTSGFGLVAALAWNNVIKEFVDNYISKWFPQGGGVLSLLIYALVITALAVLVTYNLSKVLDRMD